VARASAHVLTLRRVDPDQVIADRVTVAGSYWDRLRGLMGRASLVEGEGLFLPGTTGVHMLFMRFPIDCLFVGEARDGIRTVLAVRPNLQPWRGVVWHVRGARGVVELPVGTLDAHGVNVGDRVHLEPSDNQE
jgi:uncharacterized protein